MNIHTRKSGWSIHAAVILAILCAGCDQAFDARGTLQDEMVVFSILSTDRKAQFVNIGTSYMSPEFNVLSYTSDNSLRDALVSIKAPNGLYVLRDTLLPREDTSRYKFPIHSYVLDPFTPLRGRAYQVIVQSLSRGVASVNIVIPGPVTVALFSTSRDVLEKPEEHPLDTPIEFTAQLGDATGYVARLYLYYDVLKGREWVEERIEIPIFSADSTTYSVGQPRYPKLTLCPPTGHIGPQYRNGYYKATINKLNEQYRSTKIIFKWTTLTILQTDHNLFQYYTLTHAEQDPHTIRLDQPILPTIHGGLGLVGAYSLDSLVTVLPEKFWGDR